MRGYIAAIARTTEVEGAYNAQGLNRLLSFASRETKQFRHSAEAKVSL
jgi:hypothetical protein